MSKELLPFTRGLKWRLRFGKDNAIIATFTKDGTTQEFKRQPATEPLTTGEWAFIPSVDGHHALAWFVMDKNKDIKVASGRIMAMESAHDVLFKVEGHNVFLLPNTIAVRNPLDCIRLAIVYQDNLMNLATEAVRSAKQIYCEPGSPAIVNTRDKKHEMVQRETIRRKQFQNLMVRAMLWLPEDIRRKIIVLAELKSL